ncbi:ABC transporter permease [Microbacterium sp. Y-01]|uniref:ABC transporter permease n=1 Tax=Microbacterium sp. Y-01 TaxID=2048898 RepID=UPI000F5DDFFD|nr:ABC transporter permease [Microbacterium sp. Y-01]AZH79024.1 ABC transporter permease [Microbacterium sp. Y-01]
MLRLIARRLAGGLSALFAVATLTFVLLNFSASNVARGVLGESATPAQVAAKEAELGLDRPLAERYLAWLGGAIRGDFGVSWFTGQPVTTSIVGRLPTTLSVVVCTILVAAVLAVAVGVTAAARRGWVDRLLQIVAVGGAAVPQFLVAVLLVSLLAVQARIFPATGYHPITDGVGAWALSITLPVAALAFGAMASTAQQVRGATIDELSRDYVRTLRSRGLGSTEILLRHALRSAAPSALTVLSLQFIAMLGGAVIIEQIFALPGIGFLALSSTTQGDMPVLMGVVVYVVIMVVIVNLLVDVAVGWLNPKARAS